MIVILEKRKVILVCLVFTLLLAIISLNINDRGDTGIVGNKGLPAIKDNSKQRTIVLDPGHGGEDPGAISDYSGIKEKDLNLKIAFKLKELLENHGYNIIMTRTEDILNYEPGTTDIYQKRRQDLNQRKEIIDKDDVDIAVSIHFNKFPQTQYYGAQVFFPPDSESSQRLANSIQNCLKEIADPTNKRMAMVKEPPQGQSPIIILRDVKTTTVIVECGFLSNFNEEKNIRTDEYQDKVVEAIKAGIDNYFFKNHNTSATNLGI